LNNRNEIGIDAMAKLGLEHYNLDQKVYQAIKTMVANRQLTPGTKIFQDKLAQELGVSRTPLVNALKKLEHEKLITAIPRRGFFVRVISKEEMIQVFELREVLEGLAARRAAAQLSDAQAARLRNFFASFSDTDAGLNLTQYAEEDRRFHKYLIHIGGTDMLASILETYNVLTFSYQSEKASGLIRAPQETLHEHRAIIRGLCDRDPERAEAAARQHLVNTAKRLRQELSGDIRAAAL
jgi:DNA-binding GntR family transcriptional regulator